MKEAGRRKPSGTLASAAESNPVVERPPRITIEEERPQVSRGVPAVFVVALVTLALAAGFLLGWALRGRSALAL